MVNEDCVMEKANIDDHLKQASKDWLDDIDKVLNGELLGSVAVPQLASLEITPVSESSQQSATSKRNPFLKSAYFTPDRRAS